MTLLYYYFLVRAIIVTRKCELSNSFVLLNIMVSNIGNSDSTLLYSTTNYVGILYILCLSTMLTTRKRFPPCLIASASV